MRVLPALACVVALGGCTSDVKYDVLIRGGTVYDGSGGPPRTADLAIEGDKIVQIGDLASAQGKIEIDAQDLAVAPASST